MNRRRLMLVFLLYLTFDLTNPFVAGAFNFNPDECVEGVRRASSYHQSADAPALPARTPVVRLVASPTSPSRPAARGRHAVLEWLIDSREGQHASADLPRLSEDH